MRTYISIILLFIFCFFSCSNSTVEEQFESSTGLRTIGEFIDDWTFKVFPPNEDAFNSASFRLWVPDDVTNLKAILVLLSYTDGSTFGEMNLDEWRSFALTEKLGLLGVDLRGADKYTKVEQGSADALIKAVDTITYRNNIVSVGDLPFLLLGYSSGASFGYEFSNYKPERVVAFASIRGAGRDTSKDNIHLPGLVILAENDIQSRNERIIEMVSSTREEGSVFGYAIEPNVNHFGDLYKSWSLTRSFFSSALDKRISDENNELNNIHENSGWLGNNTTKEISSFNDFQNLKKDASWLINEDFAIKWRDFQMD